MATILETELDEHRKYQRAFWTELIDALIRIEDALNDVSGTISDFPG